MNEINEAESGSGNQRTERGEVARPLYVLTDLDGLRQERQIDIADLWHVVVASRWVIGLTAAAFAAIGLTVALLATPMYRAEVVISPVPQDARSAMATQLGSLAGLAGISFQQNRHEIDAMAMLESRAFIREFIEDKKLLTVLFESEWDEVNQKWKAEDPDDWPDFRDAIDVFQSQIMSVMQDRQTSVVTLSITWSDAETAADWANDLVKRVNDRMPNVTLRETQASLAYLREQIDSVDQVELRRSIASLIESQLNTEMMARVRAEYAFRVIDSAIAPKRPSWPKRRLIVMFATVVGVIVGVAITFVRHFIDTKTASA